MNANDEVRDATIRSGIFASGVAAVITENTVSSDGRYLVNRQPVAGRGPEGLAQSLADAAKGGKDSVVIISADATATHQSVITVMEAARRVGLSQITFATQSSAQAGGR